MLYRLVIRIIKSFLSLFADFSVVNKDKIPVVGPFIVACNHSTWLDTIFLPLAFSPQVIRFMVKQELINNRLFGWFFKGIYCFPVNRERPGSSSIKIPIALLKRGEIVAIMPTGTRDFDAALKQGVALIALKSRATIVPVVYKGPKTIGIKNLFKRAKVEIIFGDPITSGGYADYSSHDLLGQITDLLEKEINRLIR
ncbi:MAG: 1-acyl-sn-glycerol-3-phosphate acyltransferase [Gammaproteobacteria bacterium]|nr:1-acyl-sn-glycerol-3-phosphate acyltransferase [Gammaproteobacteria bacterium]